MPKKAPARRARVPIVKRVASRHGYMVVRYDGTDYALVPLEEIERLEDEQDLRDGQRALDRIKRGLEKTIPYDRVRRALGLV